MLSLPSLASLQVPGSITTITLFPKARLRWNPTLCLLAPAHVQFKMMEENTWSHVWFSFHDLKSQEGLGQIQKSNCISLDSLPLNCPRELYLTFYLLKLQHLFPLLTAGGWPYPPFHWETESSQEGPSPSATQAPASLVVLQVLGLLSCRDSPPLVLWMIPSGPSSNHLLSLLPHQLFPVSGSFLQHSHML